MKTEEVFGRMCNDYRSRMQEFWDSEVSQRDAMSVARGMDDIFCMLCIVADKLGLPTKWEPQQLKRERSRTPESDPEP